jgi:hypothetical protein
MFMLITLAFVALLAAPVRNTTDLATSVAAKYAASSADEAETKSREMKTLTSCGPLRKRNTLYALQNDVTSAGTCFSIEEDNITLDLNGHTVTYATTDGTKATFGVLAADCWEKSVEGNPCGGSHRHSVVMNGKIVQGPGAASMSHALRFGQASNLTGIIVHDLDITISAQDSIGIYSEYLPGGSDIYRNTIHNNVKVISNRHQFRGASIKLDEEGKAKLPDLIHDNTIIGGPHAGIRSDNPAGTRIYGNDVSQDTTYTNGFCIDAAGKGMEVSGNKCHPTHGRGIHTHASGVKIFDNVIETIDSDKNAEYNGCEINGTYGIQIESDGPEDPTDIRVYHNQVKVHAAECTAEAMRLTELKKGASVEIYDNTFVAVQDKIGLNLSDKGARGFSVGDVSGDHVVFTHNIVQADTAIFHTDWDSCRSMKLKENTFRAGVHGTGTLLAEFANGVSPSQENIFENNVIQGFSPSSAKFGEYVGDSWFVVVSALKVHLDDQSGAALAGATVEAIGLSEPSGSVVSDAHGDAQLSIPLLRVENKQPLKKYAPQMITINREGCLPERVVLPQPQPSEIRRTLTCNARGN